MKLSLYTIVCNLIDYFGRILLNVDEYSRSKCEDELEFIVLDVSSEDMRIKVQTRLENISKTWNKKISVKYFPYAKDPGIYNMRLDVVNYCTGDYIACVDGDDHFVPNALEKIINIINNNYGYDIYEYSSQNIRESGVKLDITESYASIKTFNLSALEDADICCKFYLWNHVIKLDIYKRAISNLPKIKKTYCEDVMILFMIYKESKTYYGMHEIFHIRVFRSNSDSAQFNWTNRDIDDVISYPFVKIIYDVIDSDKLFKCDVIKNNSRYFFIGTFRKNDYYYLRHYCFRCLNLTNTDADHLSEDKIEYIVQKYKYFIESKITKFEEVYGAGSYEIMHKIILKYGRNLPRFLLDKYGVGLEV